MRLWRPGGEVRIQRLVLDHVMLVAGEEEIHTVAREQRPRLAQRRDHLRVVLDGGFVPVGDDAAGGGRIGYGCLYEPVLPGPRLQRLVRVHVQEQDTAERE